MLIHFEVRTNKIALIVHVLSTCKLYITIDALEYYGVQGISSIYSALVVNQFLITNLTFYI